MVYEASMIKRLIRGIVLSLAGSLLLVMPVLASTITGATYKGDVTITNASTLASMVSVPFTLSTPSLVTNGYIEADCLNTSMQINGTDVAYMPGYSANPWIVYVSSIANGSNIVSKLYTGGPDMGGKIRYFPAAGGMTTADSATLEFGADFAHEVKAYFTGATGTVYNKGTAYYESFVEANKFFAYKALSVAGYTPNTTFVELGNGTYTRTGENIGTLASGNYVKVTLELSKTGNPTGTLSVVMRKTADDSLIGTFGTIDVSTIAGARTTYTFWGYVNNPVNQNVRILAEYSGGNAGNYILTYYDNYSMNDGNNVCYYSGGAYTDGLDTMDYGFSYYNSTIFGYATIPAGEHTYKCYIDGANFKVDLDGVNSSTTAFTGSIADNANDHTYFTASNVPYMEYTKTWIGGVLQQHVYWEYGATFNDASAGNHDATPTFRTTSSDADVSAALTSFVPTGLSSASIIPGATVALVTSADGPDIADFPSMYDEGETGGFWGFEDLLNPALATADIPEAMFWYPIAFVIAIALGFAAFYFTRQLIVQAVVSAVTMACFAGGGVLGDGLIPYWTVIIFAVEALLIILIQEHQKA